MHGVILKLQSCEIRYMHTIHMHKERIQSLKYDTIDELLNDKRYGMCIVLFPAHEKQREGLGDGPVCACISAGICVEPIKSTNYNLAGSQSQL